MRTLISHRILWILPVLFLWCTDLSAQGRINFSAFAGEGITISTPQGPTELNFNSKRRIVTPNTPEKIIIRRGNQEDEGYSVIYRIEAAEGFDLLVDVSAPTALRITGDTNPDNQVPFALTMAYENKGANNVNQARATSIEVPPGLTSLIIPVLPRSTGTPGPPPDPFSGDFSSRPKRDVYLFLYGEVGPIGNVKSGNYSGDIVINVTYAGSSYE
jgi:hypothetical protein